jgi:hypothetical protein
MLTDDDYTNLRAAIQARLDEAQRDMDALDRVYRLTRGAPPSVPSPDIISELLPNSALAARDRPATGLVSARVSDVLRFMPPKFTVGDVMDALAKTQPGSAPIPRASISSDLSRRAAQETLSVRWPSSYPRAGSSTGPERPPTKREAAGSCPARRTISCEGNGEPDRHAIRVYCSTLTLNVNITAAEVDADTLAVSISAQASALPATSLVRDGWMIRDHSTGLRGRLLTRPRPLILEFGSIDFGLRHARKLR